MAKLRFNFEILGLNLHVLKIICSFIGSNNLYGEFTRYTLHITRKGYKQNEANPIPVNTVDINDVFAHATRLFVSILKV